MVKAPYFATDTTFCDVYGIKVDIAFIENNLVPCSELKGYTSERSSEHYGAERSLDYKR
jgi:hypothetical protein